MTGAVRSLAYMASFDYECIVCTRNRLESLRLSIPTLLQQTRPAARIIIADSSDDHEEVRDLVAALTAESPCEVVVIRSPRGSTVQRNAGLQLVTAPIVLFADDDSLLDGDCAERLLEVYQRDVEGGVGCVVGAPRARPKERVSASAPARMHWTDRIRMAAAYPRVRLEALLVPDPLITLHWSLKSLQVEPAWLTETDAVPSVWVRGFCMSFRTDTLRALGGFDETLRDYAAFEDIHAGLSVTQGGQIVLQAARAKVFHNRAVGGRGSAWLRGAINVTNRVYVVACHSSPGSVYRRQAAVYSAYRCALYAVGSIWSRSHRESFRGARRSLARMRPLLDAAPDLAPTAYSAVLESIGAQP